MFTVLRWQVDTKSLGGERSRALRTYRDFRSRHSRESGNPIAGSGGLYAVSQLQKFLLVTVAVTVSRRPLATVVSKEAFLALRKE